MGCPHFKGSRQILESLQIKNALHAQSEDMQSVLFMHEMQKTKQKNKERKKKKEERNEVMGAMLLLWNAV